ncbi:MAG TPA: tetratricopeptide repeat protein [candidate division Zixibacteria bacterium]
MKIQNSKISFWGWFLLCSVFILPFSLYLSGCGVKNPGLVSAKIYLNLVPPDYDKATEQLLLAVKQDSLNCEAHYLLGKIYAEKDLYREMMAEFGKVEKCKLKPKDADIQDGITEIKNKKWNELWNAGVELGKKRLLVDRLKIDLLTDFSKYPIYKDSLKAISAELDNPDQFSWDSYQMYSQAKPALEDLENTLAQETVDRYQLDILIDSTIYGPYLNLAVEYGRRDQLDLALEYYQKALDLKPDDPQVMNNYALTLLAANRFDQALEIYQKILQTDSTNVNALSNLAMIYDRGGNKQKALSAYSEIISVDPEFKDAYFNRGLLYLTKSQEKSSQVKYDKDAWGKKPKDKALSAAYQASLDDYNQIFASAESDFRKAIQIDPNDQDAYFHLGLLFLSRAQLLEAGKAQDSDYTQAEDFFKKSLEFDPQNTDAMKYLGFTLMSERKWEEASLQLEKLVELNSADREAWGYLAITYARLGKKTQADAAFKKSGR